MSIPPRLVPRLENLIRFDSKQLYKNQGQKLTEAPLKRFQLLDVQRKLTVSIGNSIRAKHLIVHMFEIVAKRQLHVLPPASRIVLIDFLCVRAGLISNINAILVPALLG